MSEGKGVARGRQKRRETQSKKEVSGGVVCLGVWVSREFVAVGSGVSLSFPVDVFCFWVGWVMWAMFCMWRCEDGCSGMIHSRTPMKNKRSGNGVGDRLYCSGTVGKQSETVGNGLGTGVKKDQAFPRKPNIESGMTIIDTFGKLLGCRSLFGVVSWMANIKLLPFVWPPSHFDANLRNRPQPSKGLFCDAVRTQMRICKNLCLPDSG